MEKNTAKKRVLKGEVVSDKMQKTRVVEVTRLKMHPKYHKYYKVTKRYKAHDENGQYKTGDVVIIEETRPISKDKRWKIKNLVEKSRTKAQDFAAREPVPPEDDTEIKE